MDALTAELLADLRRKATEATPGEWKARLDGSGCVEGPSREHVASAWHMDGLQHNRNAAYIAATNPAVVLALLSKLDEWGAMEDECLKALEAHGRRPQRPSEALEAALERVASLERLLQERTASMLAEYEALERGERP
jgi:hypothetical protein